MLPSWLRVLKNPKHWTLNYSVVLFYQRGKLICSQHKTKQTAIKAAEKLVRKYKTAKGIHDVYLGWGK